VSGQHPKIARPKVTMAPAELETRHPMYVASCAHCDWTAGPTAKSWLSGTEMPLHRRAHREGRVAVTR
jgi:hypothetical protein